MAETTETRRESGARTIMRAFPEQTRSMWQAAVKGVGTIEALWIGRSLALVLDYERGNGWNVFTPTTDAGRIDETLRALAERCGVELDPERAAAAQKGAEG